MYGVGIRSTSTSRQVAYPTGTRYVPCRPETPHVQRYVNRLDEIHITMNSNSNHLRTDELDPSHYNRMK
jgi:hypothetical protein